MFQPSLIQTPRLRWSAGSVLFLASWAVLMGPIQYAQHLTSGSRLPFTAAYFGSIALTMYFAVGVSSISLFHDKNGLPLSYLASIQALTLVLYDLISLATCLCYGPGLGQA